MALLGAGTRRSEGGSDVFGTKRLEKSVVGMFVGEHGCGAGGLLVKFVFPLIPELPVTGVGVRRKLDSAVFKRPRTWELVELVSGGI